MTRSWLTVVALALIPILVYWPAVSHEYGFRDDYAHLREVREHPEGLMELTASSGRPVYGYLLEASLRPLRTVGDLSTLRLASTLLLSSLGVLLWAHLRRSGWSELEAATIAAATTLLPGAQVIASWAIAWPIALGLVAAAGGFTLVDRGLLRRGLQRTLLVAAGGALYFTAGLTYQTSALFAVMLLAAVLLLRKDSNARSDARWVLAHLSVLMLSLAAGWVLMNAVFTTGAVPEAARMNLEPNPLLKLLWFARDPLPNSLALFALRDLFDTPLSFFVVLAAVVTIIVPGYVFARDKTQRRRWMFAALVLPFVAHSVSLAANSAAIGYRTLLPLSGLFLVLVMFGLRALVARFNMRQAVHAGICTGILVSAAWLAQHNAYYLIAEPQGREWSLVQAAAARLRFDADTQVFLVRPMIGDRSTERVYADEFGSLSSDAEWAAEEMFKAAMRERFPSGLPAGARYALDTGFAPPALRFDLVVDLRKLRQLREGSVAAATALRR